MLIEIVQFPPLFRVPQDQPFEGFYYTACLRLLQDSVVRCIILGGGNNETRDEILRIVDKWPIKYRPRAKALIAELVRRNRFVSVAVSSGDVIPRVSPACAIALGIANEPRSCCAVTPTTCECADLPCAMLPRRIPISEYQSFDETFLRLTGCRDGLEILDGEWSKAKFEQYVWRPLFQSVKRVKIIDKIIGSKLADEMFKFRRRHPGTILTSQDLPPLVAFAQNFTNSFEWIFQQFVSHSQPTAHSEFVVMCEMNKHYRGITFSRSEMLAGAGVLRAFGNAMTNKYGFAFEIVVKERTSQGLPHARYLFTDQVQLLFERGFDLLNNQSIRDICIKYVDDPGKIEQRTRTLLDVR